MKIGLISFHSFFQPGGVKKHILGLHQAFKKQGVQSKIIAPRRKRSENYGREVILLGTSFPLYVSGTQTDLCINFNPLAIERVLRRERFDILHFHNFGFPSTGQILVSPITSNSLKILTLHANLEGSKFLKRFPEFLRLTEKVVQWNIDGIIGVAPLNLRYFKNFKGPKKVIPNGIDPEEFNPRIPKIRRFLDDKINILFVGRIEERKGLIYLLKAYKILEKKFSNLRLIIVGKGKLKKECEEYAKKNKLKEVHFEGERTGKDVPPYFTSSDIFVSPAIFGESFGIVLLEAMASGLPIVAFANQGYKEFLQGKKGERFLVKPKSYKGLADKIESLIKSKKLRGEMGRWGIKEAQNYSWDKIADRVLNFYQLCTEIKKRDLKSLF